MVRIINYKERQAEDGSTFYALEIQGGIEMIKSQESGNFYATARRASIVSTFDEATCKALVGSELSGMVEKQSCDLYEYTIKETGEVIELAHRYVYVPENESKVIEKRQPIIADPSVFSTNGSMEPAFQ